MAKQKLSGVFATDNQLYIDLEQYLQFCVEYGYKYDESTLYDQRSNTFRQYSKFLAGKNFRNCWEEDAKAYEAQYK